MQSIPKHLSTFVKVAAFIARPFKSLAIFEHYLAISAQTGWRTDSKRQIRNQNQNRNQFLVKQFKFLFAILTYFILLNTVLFIAAQASSTPDLFPLLHILSFDTRFFFRLPNSFYLLYTLECLLAFYLLFLFYFRPNDLITDRLRSVLFRNNRQTNREKYSNGRSSLALFKSSSPLFSPTFAIDSSTRAAALKLTNTLEGFILLIDFCFLFLLIQYWRILWEKVQHFSCFASDQYYYPTVVLATSGAALFFLLLVHALVFAVALYSLSYVLILTGTFGFAGILYAHLLLRFNTEQLKRVTGRAYIPGSPESGAHLQLCKLLRQNVTIFRLLFAGNAFLGNAFFAFLVINFPVNAVLTVALLFSSGKMDRFSLFVMMVFVVHELLGTVLMHVAIARLSRHLHSGGRYLVGFSARSSGSGVCGGDQGDGDQIKKRSTIWRCKVKGVIALRHRLTIWMHTLRLVTANRYSITYGLIGAPVTMATFTGVIF